MESTPLVWVIWSGHILQHNTLQAVGVVVSHQLKLDLLSFSACLWHWCSPENLWASSNAARFTAANRTFGFMNDTQIDATGVGTARKIYILLHSKVLFRMHATWATTSFFMLLLCVQSRCCKGTEIANCWPFPHKKNNQHCSTCMYV